MKKIDVLLLARPDHSYEIYKELLGQNKMSFLYCSFKLLPIWLKRFVKSPRVRYYSKYYSNCILQSFFHIYRVKRNKQTYEKYEKFFYELHLRHFLPSIKPHIIHYWPYYSYEVIRKYKKKYPEIRTFADVYYPCENWVIDNIFPDFEKLGLSPNNIDKVERDASKLKEIMSFEDNFLVPSKFIAETYKQYYPNKNYIVVPYGISVWQKYVKKEYKNNTDQITSFVFAGGGVTIEKGCDLMLDYFIKNPELELHIYGTIPDSQIDFFKQYTISDNIHFHGMAPKSKLQTELCKYDVGIHFSRFDAYSLSVGEMIGAGLPVIVSDRTGICTLVEDNDVGLVTKLNVPDIERCIQTIRTPKIYNKYIDNLDEMIKNSPLSYGKNMLNFYYSHLN